MKILWIVTLVILLSVAGYSGLSGAPLKVAAPTVDLDASAAVLRNPVQLAAAPVPGSTDKPATDLSAYVLLHKTRYETIRGEARANMCPE